MHISYQKIVSWFKVNFQVLIVVEAICLAITLAYFAFAPRIYEANFSLSLPKVSVISPSNPGAPQLRLLISPQEFIRPTQNPMAYSSGLIEGCMGSDTNANRKKMITSMQLSVQQQGDVVALNLRLEGRERVIQCANLILNKAFGELVTTQENYLASLSKNQSIDYQKSEISKFSDQEFKKPEVIQAIRISDSYVKPDFYKLFIQAILTGIFMTIFISIMRKRYRA